jgi:hypothetical protein
VSLIDRPPHLVTVQPRKKAEDPRYGDTWVDDGDPVEVACAVQPATSTEAVDLGLEITSLFTLIVRRWPYGPHARVLFEGREFEQVGEVRRYRMSTRTSHDDVTLRAVGVDG